MRHLFIALICSLSFNVIFAQETSVYSEINAHYKEGLRLFSEGVYVAARKEFETVLNAQRLSFEPEYKTLHLYAEYYSAIAALRLKLEDADLMVTEFIKRHRPDPIAEKANLEVANYHFDQKNYTDALIYYKLMDTRGMPSETLSEVKFKEGYSYFAKKDFKNASASFTLVKDSKGEYYFPTNYYLGMSHYFNGKYDQAISSFEIAAKSKKYSTLIPYYITQIYFSQKQYDKLITYAQPIIDGAQKVDKSELIRRMVGHAYFIKQDYAKALEQLDTYEKNGQTLEEADYYAMGYSNYIAGRYAKAVPYFSILSAQQSQIGQNSNYYLADCYLRSGNTLSARTAFYNVSRLPYQDNIREEALFNYGKLSAELGFERESITALSSFTGDSKYYTESQNIIGDVLDRTKDYDNAIRTIESIKNPSQRLKASYQQLTYRRALQLINEDRSAEAIVLLSKAIDPSYDKNISLSAMYWQADLAHRQGDVNLSIQYTDKFMTAAGTGRDLKDPMLLPMANYLQGYNQLKKKDYLSAGTQFNTAIEKFKKINTSLSSPMLPDAYLRSADCSFKRNRYDEAINLYNQVIKPNANGSDYAQYQSAIIQGLKNNKPEKIRLLNDLVNKKASSTYADEALYELALTYSELSQPFEAITSLKKLLKDYPGTNIYNRTLIQLGLLTYNQGNKSEALNDYKEVFRHNPTPQESQEAMTAIQEIYVDDLGQPDEYIKFVESTPGYNLTNYSRDSLNYGVALRYYEDGQYERAIASFTDYLQKFPRGLSLIPALYKRGESNVLLKKYDPALSDYEAVIQKGRSELYDKSLFKAATLAYNYQQNFEKSLKYYSELAKNGAGIDENTLFESQLGSMRSAYRLGRTNEVTLYGDKVYNSPKVNNEQKATAGFYLGKIAFDQKNYNRANEYLKSVVSLSDNEQTAEARYLLAEILFLQKSIPTAEASTRSAISQNADYPYWVAKCMILLSDIFVEKNDFFNARAALEAVLENFKEDADLTTVAQSKLAIVKSKQASGNKLKQDSLKINSFFDNN